MYDLLYACSTHSELGVLALAAERGRSSSAHRRSVRISARDGGEMRGNTLLDEREVRSAFVADGQHHSSEALKVNGEF